MDVPGPWAPSSRLRRRTRRGPTQPPCASGMPPHGRTRCARRRRRRSWEAALPSMGYRTGRRNAHVIREGHVIRGRCHRNGVSRASPRRSAAGRLPCVRTQPFPTSRGVASAQERPARARALACRPSRRRDGRRPAAVQGRSDPVAGQLAQHRELRAARLELGDDSRDEHDRATVNRRAGGRVLRAGSAEPTKRADRVRIVPRVRGTLIEAARAAARTRDTFLAAHHHRVRARRGANRASLAVAHALLVAVWRMLQTGEIVLDPGGDYYARRDPPAPPDGSSPGTSASVLSHAARSAGGDLNEIFSSQTTSGNASFRPSRGGRRFESGCCGFAGRPRRRRTEALSRSRRPPSRGVASSPKGPAFLAGGRGRPRGAARSWLHRQGLWFGVSPLDHRQPVPSLEPGNGVE